MRFVKASERLPEKLLESYYCKVKGASGKEYAKTVLITLDGQWQTTLEVLSWLDESTPTSIEQEAETL